MNKALILATITILSCVAAQAAAQSLTATDAALVGLSVSPAPTVGLASTATATVRVDGPATVEVSFTFSDGSPLSPSDPTDPASGSTVRQALRAAGTHEFAVQFTPLATRAGDATLRAVATMLGDTDGTNNARDLATFVRAPSLNITLAPLSFPQLPSQGVSFLRFVIRNDGNANESPTVITTLLANASAWEVDVASVPEKILPGDLGEGVIRVVSRSDNDTLGLSLLVTARSSANFDVTASVTAPSYRANLSVSRLPHMIAIRAVPSESQVPRDGRLNLSFDLMNTGDVDDVFRLSATFSNVSWTPRLTLEGSRVGPPSNANVGHIVALRAGESTRVALHVLGPANATQGAELLIQAASHNEAILTPLFPNGLHNVSTSVRFTPAGADVAILGLASIVAYAGDVVQVRVEARNIGLVSAPAQNATLEVRDNLAIVLEERRAVPTLATGESTALSWQVPTVGRSGRYFVTVRTQGGTVGDANATNDVATATLDVRSPRISALTPETIAGVPGRRTFLSTLPEGLGVANNGPDPEPIEATLTSSFPWLSGSWSLTAAPHASTPLELDVVVPPYVGAESGTATLSLRIPGRSLNLASVDLRVVIDDREPPTLEILAPLAQVTLGERLRITARATDAIGIERIEAIVTAPDGERQFLPLFADGSDIYVGTYEPRGAGAHGLELRAYDSSSHRNLARIANATFEIQAPSAAGLDGVGFRDGDFIRATTLRFEERVLGTTRLVEVASGSDWRRLAPPYNVTVPAREGDVRITLRSTTHAGGTLVQTWNLTLDTTPPGIGATTAKESADGRVLVHLTASAASRAVAIFETAEGSARFDLAGPAGGPFAATLTPPAGWTSVSAAATDAAGNEATSAAIPREVRETPSPILMALVALAACALVTRRRRIAPAS